MGKETKNEKDYVLSVLVRDRAIQCLGSFYEFFKEFWDINQKGELVINWHIPYLCNELQKLGMRIINGEIIEEDTTINIPPGTTKSSIVSIAWPLWLWLHKPDCGILHSSHEIGLGIDHSAKAKKIFKSAKFQLFFQPYFIKKYGKKIKLEKDTEKEWINNFGGLNLFTSTNGRGIGRHGNVLIRDDAMSPTEAQSEAYRKKSHYFYDETFSSRKKDKERCPTVTVQQRLHEEDTTGHDQKRGVKTNLICLPAKLSDDVHPKELRQKYINGYLDPKRLNQKVLDAFLVKLGSYGFAGQFQQNPCPEEGGYVKKRWFRYFNLSELENKAYEAREELVWNFTIDTAFTDKEGNDPSAIMAYTYFQGNMYVREVWVGRLEIEELLNHIPEFVKGNGYTNSSQIYVEPKANGKDIVVMIKRHTELNITEGEVPKEEKIVRLRRCIPFIEAGRLYLLKNGTYIDSYIHEICAFGVTKHDDQVDITTMAIDQAHAPQTTTEIYSITSI